MGTDPILFFKAYETKVGEPSPQFIIHIPNKRRQYNFPKMDRVLRTDLSSTNESPRRSPASAGEAARPGGKRWTLTSSCSKWAGIWALGCSGPFPSAETAELSLGQPEPGGVAGSRARLGAETGSSALGILLAPQVLDRCPDPTRCAWVSPGWGFKG